MTNKLTIRLLSASLLLVLSGTALAHPGHGASGLAVGLMHPFTGLDHLLAMVAVGLWAAQNGGRKAWLLPAAFMLMLVAGADFALSYPALHWVETGIAASVLALGLLVALSLRLPAMLGITLTALFGFLHGYAHGLELPGGSAPAAYALGFLTATLTLHLCGIAAGLASRERFAQLSRALGVAIAASGVWMLASIQVAT